jgi:hypothetical protein
MTFDFWEEDLMILMEFGESLKGKYFHCDFWGKYLLIDISVTILSPIDFGDKEEHKDSEE